MAAVITMVDRNASDIGRGAAAAATSPCGAPADRLRCLEPFWGHFRASENAVGARGALWATRRPMPLRSAGPDVCVPRSALHAIS